MKCGVRASTPKRARQEKLLHPKRGSDPQSQLGRDAGNQGDGEERRRKRQPLKASGEVAAGRKQAPKFWIPRLTGGGRRRQLRGNLWPGRSHSSCLLSRPAVKIDAARSIKGSLSCTSGSYGPEGTLRGLWAVEAGVGSVETWEGHAWLSPPRRPSGPGAAFLRAPPFSPVHCAPPCAPPSPGPVLGAGDAAAVKAISIRQWACARAVGKSGLGRVS